MTSPPESINPLINLPKTGPASLIFSICWPRGVDEIAFRLVPIPAVGEAGVPKSVETTFELIFLACLVTYFISVIILNIEPLETAFLVVHLVK